MGSKQKKGFFTPSKYTQWVDALELDRTWFGRWGDQLEKRFRIKRVGLVFLFSFALSNMILSHWQLGFRLEVGDVVRTSIHSPANFEFIDEITTDQKRATAANDVPPVYDINLDLYEKRTEKLVRAFRMMRGQLPRSPLISEQTRLEKLESWRGRFEQELGLEVPDRVWVWLVEQRFAVKLENLFVQVLDHWAQMRVADQLVGSEATHEIVVRAQESNRGNGHGEEFRVNVSEAHDISRRSEFENVASKIFNSLDRQDQRLALRFISPFLVTNMHLNEAETNARRELARNNVGQIRVSIRKNQVLAQAGTKLTSNQKIVLNQLDKVHYGRRSLTLAFACALMLTTLILVFFSYLRRFTLNRVKVSSKDILCMGVVTLLVVGICKLILAIAELSLLTRLGPWLPESSLIYLMPVAAGPMLVGLLLASGEVLWLFTVFLASAIGVMADMNFPLILVAIVSGMSAARGVFNCKKRSDVYWAGVRSSLVSSLMIVLISGLTTQTADEFYVHAFTGAVFGCASGLLSSLITMMLIPLIENSFNYTTDVKLLELSNLNHPLLKDLIVRAPGTYHHSLVVGSMVEAAAEEIGANPLLAKVMAYYHDIGKMEHAQYFIENQRPGNNPHDQISPHMSKHILVAHVKDGAELAIKHKLGQPIVDGILQHHGTTLISFFYNKAQEQQDESQRDVKEEDFRYPGPKPQFREAALCMIADSIEAAARSLDEPTSTRLQNIVKNIIQRKFMDGQLEECNLTLRDLSILENSFNRTLLGIYHSRIDYSRQAGGGASEPHPSVSSLRAVSRS